MSKERRNELIAKRIAEYTEKNTRTKELALAALIRARIIENA